MRETRRTRPLPLDGVHVLDFGHWVAGPLAAEILANLGASVIKVESFLGDPLGRSLPGPYAAANHGKLSLAINLKASQAREVVKRLVKWSDLITYNFRPGVAERLGIGAEQVRQIDSSVGVIATTAYGARGPSMDRPGFDPVFLALSGYATRAGGAGRSPICGTRLGPIDNGAGMLGAFGAVTALYRSRRTGAGGSVGVSLLDTSLFLMDGAERKQNVSLVDPTTLDCDRTGPHPAEALYQLKDGWVAIIATQESARCSLVSALNLASIATRPSQQWTEDDRNAISSAVAEMTREELAQKLAGIEVSVVPCAADAKARILTDPALIDAGLIVPAEDSRMTNFIGFPVQFEQPRDVRPSRSHVPTLGEHTDDVLRLVGFTDEEIAALHNADVVKRSSAS